MTQNIRDLLTKNFSSHILCAMKNSLLELISTTQMNVILQIKTFRGTMETLNINKTGQTLEIIHAQNHKPNPWKC